ncbi:MAG: hypothetical protein ACRD3Q_02965 [Terriglobales bacterium]
MTERDGASRRRLADEHRRHLIAPRRARAMSAVVALPRTELARVAPNYEAMRMAIAKCEKVDEIANFADQAVAAQAYFRQSQDVDNEMQASRIRVRAERRLGEILKAMAANGERKKQGNEVKSRGATSLKDLGIPKDRASSSAATLCSPPTASCRSERSRAGRLRLDSM